jgi:hypothetical protein
MLIHKYFGKKGIGQETKKNEYPHSPVYFEAMRKFIVAL